MRRPSLRALVLALFLPVLVNAGISEAGLPVSPADMQKVTKGNNAFALELYARLKAQEGNLFFSPYSISSALAMTYAGARGNTETEMARVLHFELERGRLHHTFKELLDEFNARGKKGRYELRVANALWGQKGYGFLKEFLQLTRKYYDAGLEEVDFVGATEAARQTINAWVEKKTKGKVKDLIKPGVVLNPVTVLVLTNAIYFKGDWASKFKEKRTKLAPFKLTGGRQVDVPLMYQTEEFKFMEGAGFQALELPYVGGELSMVVLLPKDAAGLADLEKSFTMGNLKRWLSKLHKQQVRVYLPRLKMTCGFRLGKALQAMGMKDAFSGAADFSGITGIKELFISAVIHQAFVEVNEEGTEAAAATAVVMERGLAGIPQTFRADHPFIFLIRDVHSNSILFLGRVTNPKA